MRGTLGDTTRPLGTSKIIVIDVTIFMARSNSGLATAVLGLPLDKSEQMANWEARPLTARQQNYAALDAAVLVLLFAALRDRVHSSAVYDVVPHPRARAKATRP